MAERPRLGVLMAAMLAAAGCAGAGRNARSDSIAATQTLTATLDEWAAMRSR